MLEKIQKLLLALLLSCALCPASAFADLADDGSDDDSTLVVEDAGQFEGLTEAEIAEAVGKPEEWALNFDWGSFKAEACDEPGMAPLSLGEGTASDIVSIALGEPDGKPEGGNRNKYNNYNGAPWCAYFIVWCARQAGVSAHAIPDQYLCSDMVKYYKSKGLWHSYSYTPKAGDLIFYSTWSGGTACHVGVVTSVSDGTIYTKEGNTTGDVVAVKERTVGSIGYPSSGWYIIGYASPNYAKHSCSYSVSAYEPATDTQHSLVYANCACGASKPSSVQNCTYVWSRLTYGCSKCGSEYVFHDDGDYVAMDEAVSIFEEDDLGSKVVAAIPEGGVVSVSGAYLNSSGGYVAAVSYEGVSGYVRLADLTPNNSAGSHSFFGGVCSDCGIEKVRSEPAVYRSADGVTLYKSNAFSSSKKAVEAGGSVAVVWVGVTTDGWYWGYTADGYVLDMRELAEKVSDLPSRGETAAAEDAAYIIRLAGSSSLAIGVADASVNRGAGFGLTEYDGEADQRFNLIANEDGSYRIQNANSGLVFDAGGWLSDDTALRQDRWDGSDFQRWLIEKDAGGSVYLRSKAINLYLSVANDSVCAASALVLALPGDSLSQGFTLEKRSDAMLSRLQGVDRYQTMEAIVGEAFPEGSCEYAVVASGANYPDALAASSLAGALGAPVILSSANSLSSEAASAIEGIGAQKVIVVGGSGSVSDAVVSQLRSVGSVSSVDRVCGQDRYETARAIYAKGIDLGVSWSSSVVIATGKSFADALSISPYAYATKSPILLVDPASGLDSVTKALLSSGGFDEVIAVGGEAAVPASVGEYARSVGLSFARLAGGDRYETSCEIAKWAIAQGVLGTSHASFATGASFPDALAGGALCGSRGSVLLLVKSTSSPALTWFSSAASRVDHAYVIGGDGSVSFSLVNRICEIMSR